jgi:hypothetical protein
MALITLYGYAPDLLPDTPGVMTNCASFIPTQRGFAGAPSPRSLGISALAAACQGAAIVGKLDNTNRLFAGTATKLYELSSTSWTDRSRASGGNYGLASDARWSFAQYGDVTLAAAKADILQFSTTGAFANVGASVPKATIVEVVGQFAFLMDINDQGSIGSFGDSPDRWWCCAKGDYTDWTPATSTQCASGRLITAAGPIKAAKRFGDGIVAYKLRSMFVGTYVGPDARIWDFIEIPGSAGALGQYAVVDVSIPEEPRHIFMGADDFYLFDGTRPRPIGGDLKETVFAELNRTYAYLAVALHDPRKSRVYFYYPSSGSTTLDKCVVYNYRSQKWGRDDRSLEMVVNYISAGVTYNDLGSIYPTYDAMPNVAYDSSFWSVTTQIPAVFDTSHVLMPLDGPNVTSSFTSGDFGDEDVSTLLSRVSPRFLTKPASANMVNFHRRTLGDTLTQDQTTPMNSLARFDVLRDAFWHRVRFDFTGPVELNSINPDVIVSGTE